MTGALIAFEGLDQSGKQTQAELLRDWLKQAGRKARLVSFPDYGTSIGEEIARAPHLKRMAEAIKHNAKAQSKLIRDLLDLSRLRSGKLELNREIVSIMMAVNNAIDTVRADATAKQIAIEVAAPKEALFVHGDAVRLEQILWNLLNNAVKFTPNHGKISVHLTSDAGKLALVISDTGDGIHPDFLPHVFELFRQADASTSRVQSGMGVGLAIVKQLVESAGGRVGVESESGLTRFWFSLPA